MADFLEAYNETITNEGGYTANRSDPGNWTGAKVGVGKLIGTNLGISAAVLSAFLGRTATTEEMKSLKLETAQKIYRRNYWNVIRGDEILSQKIAASLFDSGVNMGNVRAVIELQRTLALPLSGRMDNLTLQKING